MRFINPFHPLGRGAGPRPPRAIGRRVAVAGGLVALLASAAGCGGVKGADHANLIAGKPAVEKGGKLSIPASPTGQLAYVTGKAVGQPGAATVEMPNTSGVSHNIALEQGAHAATPGGPAIASSPFTTKTTASVAVKL